MIICLERKKIYSQSVSEREVTFSTSCTYAVLIVLKTVALAFTLKRYSWCKLRRALASINCMKQKHF